MIDPLQNMPEVLYKYRDFNNEFHKRLLFNHELFFSSAAQFNDPFDATLPFKYDEKELTEDNIFKKYYSVIQRKNLEWKEEQIHQLAYEEQRKGHIKDDRQQERFEENITKQIHETIGIVSLTTTPENILMWSHYANSHTGFCIGLDSKFIFKNFGPHLTLQQMIYDAEIPRIGLFDIPTVYFTKILSTKSDLWKYEKEYRFMNRNFVNKTLDITSHALKEIHLGAKMDQKIKFDLISKIIETFPAMKIFDCSISKTEFKVDSNRVA